MEVKIILSMLDLQLFVQVKAKWKSLPGFKPENFFKIFKIILRVAPTGTVDLNMTISPCHNLEPIILQTFLNSLNLEFHFLLLEFLQQ